MDQKQAYPTGGVDWWPFTRLLITAAVLGLAAHAFFGWSIEPRRMLSTPGQMLGVLSILAMISFILADLYLLAFLLIPLYVVGVLNDWFYLASRWIAGTIFQVKSARLLALIGLAGEVFLFGSLAWLARRLLA